MVAIGKHLQAGFPSLIGRLKLTGPSGLGVLSSFPSLIGRLKLVPLRDSYYL